MKHFIRACILIAYSWMILYMDVNQLLEHYIEDTRIIYVRYSAIGLHILAAYEIYAAIQSAIGRQAVECECGHEHNHEKNVPIWKQSIIYGLFIVPCLVGLIQT